MDTDNLNMAFQQQRAMSNAQSQHGLSGVPYYIENLSMRMDRIEYKIDLLLKYLAKEKEEW